MTSKAKMVQEISQIYDFITGARCIGESPHPFIDYLSFYNEMKWVHFTSRHVIDNFSHLNR